MARQNQTAKNKRTTYVYYDANGRKQVELRPGEDGVTEADISMLHEMDDTDLNADRREDYHVPSRFEAYYTGSEDTDGRNMWLADENADPEEAVIAA